ncbi:hypothetical protein QCD70_16500 [Agreia sp. PsM10]|uniref:hypothetical protein n=1 Tax=Agreia sp. PsM10 TaxID=3030533 RepID=UPI00263BDDF0|nr:hypothetical protein [Agreia sp. PsM10]MDN4641851.1 hypothetical protein [Agreia sp. PsM10]
MALQMEPVELARPVAEPQGLFRHRAVFDSREVSVTYRLDSAEHAWRQQIGLGAVTTSRTLAALLSLPGEDLGQADPLLADAFDNPGTAAMAIILDDPDGTRWGRRMLRAPLTVVEIEVPATRWSRGRDAAHDWAGFGPRVVRVDGALPRDETFVFAEASHYGIGIRAGDGKLLLEPGEYTSTYWSLARWGLAETLYGQFLNLTS